ncbi:hypothetical protein IGI37_002123 [Enterococcus sp. AZ194]|uniref:sugar-binding transcriptional regulator n=1 Tax=Enterococcus sp. AZ194 TaxID=2774629 RepID=UPI003F1F32E4
MAYDISTLLKVAELYYLDRVNQSEIAKRMGISRPSISRILEEAREKEIVKISIEAPFERNNRLMSQLQEMFQLKDVIVVKDLGEYNYNMENVGKASADYLCSILTETSILGISWGNAVEKMVSNFPKIKMSDMKVVQLNGSLGSEGESKDGNELVFRLAQKVGGHHEFFNAPAFVDSKMLQEALLSQPQIIENIKLGKKMNIAFGGIGNLEVAHNTLVSSGILDNQDLLVLRNEGAVGTMMGRAFDLSGNEVLYKNRFPISGELESLKSAPISIGAVCLKERAKATLGAIRGGLINVLICDESLANELLNIA